MTMNYMGPIAFFSGFLIGMLLTILILQDAEASKPGAECVGKSLSARDFYTDYGLHCIIFDSGGKSGQWGTCNWDDYNFIKYHERQKQQALQKNQKEIPFWLPI